MIYRAIINKIKTNYLLTFLILIGLVWLTTCTFAHLEGYTEKKVDEVTSLPSPPIISIHHQESIARKTAALMDKINENVNVGKM